MADSIGPGPADAIDGRIQTEWGRVDIVYSADEGGWYAQRWSDDAVTTHTYKRRFALIRALDRGTVEWEK